MNRFARLILASSCSLALTVPALAGVVINSPADGSYLSSSFRLDAYSNSCGSQPVGAMGYSFDDSSNTSFVNSQSIYKYISSATGSHVLHVKSWGNNGSSCVTDIDIHVTSGSSSASSSSVSIPSGSSSVSNIQVLNWSKTHDSGGSGSASGSTYLVTSPSLYGTTRETLTTFTNSGDERYSVTFSDNTSAKNFVWDGWVYFTSSSSMLANLELDVNQTLPSGATMFAGVQCDGWTGHWSYTSNTGSVSSPRMKWIQASGTSCNPQKWSQYKWHHVQFSLSRDNSGYVTYHAVWLDGVETPLNATVPTAANDGWGPAINTQFQIDGYGSSGHVTAYLDSLKISMW